jgi:Icc-related predicted phosphoesterase
MKILFTSDLHGLESAYRSFAQILKSSYDVGVIAGDLKDDWVPPEEIKSMFNLSEDDMLDELPSNDEADPMVFFEKTNKGIYLTRALKIKGAQFSAILDGAQKPVFLIKGNHDRVEWDDTKFVKNIEFKRVELNGYNFVGYQYTAFDKTEDDQMADLIAIKRLMDKKTILVTHAPPYGILDESSSLNIHSTQPVHIGSRAIRDLVRDKPPLLHLFGHVHEKFGFSGRFVNGSYPIQRQFISIDTSTGKMGFLKENIFPALFVCKCGKKLKAVHSGQFRCPQCKTLLMVDAMGGLRI